MTTTQPTQPISPAAAQGRLADPDRSLATDPRVDRGLLKFLAGLGMDANGAPVEVDRNSTREAILAALAATDEGFNGLYAGMPNELPEDADAPRVEQQTVTAPGDHDVDIHIFRPADVSGPLPGVVYLHGGGMAILATRNKVHDQWCTSLAAKGLVVMSVDYRNAFSAEEGLIPFPAGLNDCVQAVRWIDENRADLGLSAVVLQGESGGANLVLATELKLKQDGAIDAIDGAYANVPYISGAYDWDRDRQLAELPSLRENDGYFIGLSALNLLVAAYDPDNEHAEDPLAWPLNATIEDLTGLPPHVISVNELDPLRDEGIVFYRRLLEAGVEARGRVNFGIVHGAEMIFRQAIPQHFRAAVADIAGFAESCAASTA